MKQLCAGLLVVFILLGSSIAQSPAAKPEVVRYPNELPGFKLATHYGIASLMSKTSHSSDVEKAFGKCKRTELFGCDLDENWTITILHTDTVEGPLSSILLYPRRRISFAKIRFPKTFSRGWMRSAHLPIEVGEFITWEDVCGLRYVLIGESTDERYKKWDLYYIEYSADNCAKQKTPSRM